MTDRKITDLQLDIKWVAVVLFTAGILYNQVIASIGTQAKVSDRQDAQEVRIVALETQYALIKEDTSEIKKDIKQLLKR